MNKSPRRNTRKRLLCVAGVLAAAIVMLRLRTKKESYARAFVFLGVALLPIFWTLVATQPMVMHAHFQYRILAVTMLGGMYCFTVGVLLPSTTYQEDPDQEDQEEPKGD